MASSDAQFGSFSGCSHFAYPVCTVFDQVPRECAPSPFDASVGVQIGNILDIIVSVITVIVTGAMIFRASKKPAAVGRMEMQILLTFFGLASLLEILTGGGFLASAPGALKVLTSIQIGLTHAFIVALLLNAVTAFQWIDDGSLVSILTVFGISIAYGIVTAYFAADVAFGINTAGPSHPTSPIEYPLFTLYFLLPGLFLLTYAVLFTYLVAHDLRSRRPLLLLALAILFFIFSQIWAIWIGNAICKAARTMVEGRWGVSMFETLAVICVFRFWDAITYDDEEPGDPYS